MDHHAPPGGFFNWFNNSANHPSENPEQCSYSEYPYSYPHVSATPKNFFEPAGFNPYCPIPPTSSSEAPQVVADGQGDDDEEDDEQNYEEEDNRNRRLSWTEADDIRLVSAWLNNSVDPLQGNSKKGDVCWKNITDEYNLNSPPNRRRQPKHCKDHWGARPLYMASEGLTERFPAFHSFHDHEPLRFKQGRRWRTQTVAALKTQTAARAGWVSPLPVPGLSVDAR